MKKIVIPLSMIVGIIIAVQMLSVTNDAIEKTKNGDINKASEIIVNETVEQIKDKATEPLWVALVYNPITWVLGFLGSLIGIKFVIK